MPERERFEDGRPRDPSSYSAGSNSPDVVERCLQKMEGLVTQLRDTPAHVRPKALPGQYLAGHLVCTVASVKRWKVLHDRKRSKHEQSDRFCELYDLICDLMVEQVGSKMFVIALDASNSQAFSALKYLLPRMHPVLFGEGVREENVHEAQDADIPQSTFDALSDDNRDELADIAARIAKDNARTEELLREAAERADSTDP